MIGETSITAKLSTKIGDKVIIGAGSCIGGCVIGDECVVGECAVLLGDSKMGKQSMIAAGSILAAGTSIPSGEVWAGNPAQFTRKVSTADIEANANAVRVNRKLASAHAREFLKKWEELEIDFFNHDQEIERDESYYKRLTPEVEITCPQFDLKMLLILMP